VADISIHIDPVYESKNFSVQVDDHKQQKTKILNDTYSSYDRCIKAAMIYINLIRKKDE